LIGSCEIAVAITYNHPGLLPTPSRLLERLRGSVAQIVVRIGMPLVEFEDLRSTNWHILVLLASRWLYQKTTDAIENSILLVRCKRQSGTTDGSKTEALIEHSSLNLRGCIRTSCLIIGMISAVQIKLHVTAGP
jgi:hypothetical protein